MVYYSLPIAATFINGEPCDLIQVPGFNLCKDCRSRLYGVVESIVPKQKIEKLNKRALDIKWEDVIGNNKTLIHTKFREEKI
jgi:hypothetical protein